MFKQILTFLSVLLLCACASLRGKPETAALNNLKTVNFFAEEKTQAAFKVVGTMDEFQMEGLLTAKKTETGIQVMLLSGGVFRLLDALVSPEGVEYRYLFSEVDNSLVRARITQLLDLLFSAPGEYAGIHAKNGQTRVTYKGPRAKTVLVYEGETYPAAARTVTTLNSADLIYADYMPASADGEVFVPHALLYKDGKIGLDLQLISLR